MCLVCWKTKDRSGRMNITYASHRFPYATLIIHTHLSSHVGSTLLRDQHHPALQHLPCSLGHSSRTCHGGLPLHSRTNQRVTRSAALLRRGLARMLPLLSHPASYSPVFHVLRILHLTLPSLPAMTKPPRMCGVHPQTTRPAPSPSTISTPYSEPCRMSTRLSIC